LARLAVHGRESAILPGDAVDSRQAEPGAVADRPGREERLEDALLYLLRHAFAGIAPREHERELGKESHGRTTRCPCFQPPRARRGDVCGRIVVDEQQVGAQSRRDAAAVGEAKGVRRGGRGGTQGLRRREPGFDQQLQFAVQTHAVPGAEVRGVAPARIRTPASCRSRTAS
jgi:hypothetical protein